MAKKLFFLLLCAATLNGLSAQSWKDKLNKASEALTGKSGGLSQDEVGRGLKEALDKGVKEAVQFLSQEDGYYESLYKILLPEEAEQVAGKLRAVPGFSNAEEELILRLNRAAESAASKAEPIFVEAIRQMTIQDAFDILRGKDDAATRYLEKSTFSKLFEAFKPVVGASLDEVNARSYWKSMATAYNKLPFTTDVTAELDDYVTTKALEGLFSKVEEKEKDIRENAGARTTDLLRRVFAEQD